MSNINEFIDSILNIRVVEEKEIEKLIERVIRDAKEEVTEVTSMMDGFCRFLASTIQMSLNNYQIKNYWLDLNELIGIDHVVLIAEYRTVEGIKRLLIDPSFSQFTKDDNKQLVKLEEWPSEKIEDKEMAADLLDRGLTQVDDARWQDYLNSFGQEENKISLDVLLRGDIVGRKTEVSRRRK